MDQPSAWQSLVASPFDVFGIVLYAIVFPLYHGLYPWLVRLAPRRAARPKIDAFRRSWIEGLLERGDLIAAVQQTRNLTMVNSLLASSSLILMGVTANLLLRGGGWSVAEIGSGGPGIATVNEAKLLLLIVVFAAAFAFCMTSLRHLGHFNLVIGADPKLIARLEGPPVDYFSNLVNRASSRYTLAVRSLYAASPIFAWLFDSRLFLALTLFWGFKFIGFQDFAGGLRRRPEQT